GEPRRVFATVRNLRHREYGVEDTAFVTLDGDRSLVDVRLTWAAATREIRYRFVGEHGELTGGDERVALRVGSEVEEIVFEEGMSKGSSHSGWYAPLFADFVARVRSGARDTAGLDEALYVTKLIDRAYASAEEGRVLPLG